MAKKLTTEEFIQKAKQIHGDKYNYSKTTYMKSNQKITIICPEHGEFSQTPNCHLSGSGCPKCIKKATNKESFIEEAKKIHGDKYDYSKVIYVKSTERVCIICPEHGEFWQTPGNHLSGRGCFKCRGEKIWDKRGRTTNEDWILRAQKIHGNKYDYSKVNYIDNISKICIICPEHGEFWQKAYSHLSGCGCPKCNGGVKYTQEEFIKKAREIHGDKYDYSKVNYVNGHTEVCIICHKKNEFGDEHNEFWQKPNAHLQGCGCPKCNNKYSSFELFLQRSKKIHGDKYDYSKVEFKNNSSKVCIICPEHGEFWQHPRKHINGQGCPKCKGSKLEEKIEILLRKYEIHFETQKTFDWLKYVGKMKLDFYLPDYNIAIECQGKQHFLPNCTFSNSAKESLEIVQDRDRKKRELCEEKGIKLLYFSTIRINFPYDVITNENELIKSILKSVVN